MYKEVNPADWRDAEVFAYVRKSLVLGEEDRISEVKQRDAITKACARLELPEPTWFADVKGHRSGRYEHTRPQWLAAKSRYLKAKKSVLIVYEFDRPNRNVSAMASLIEEIRRKETRYRLVLVVDDFDSARDGWGASVINKLNMNASMAQFEADKAAERMTNTIRTMQEHLVPWGTTPYGLLRQGRGMKAKWVRGAHAEQVSTLLRLYARGMGYHAVAEELNRRGMHYYKGSRDLSRNRMETPQRWNAHRVRQIVGNAMVYAGFMIPMRGRSFQRKVKLAGEGTLLERCARAYAAVRTDHIEPLIPDDVAEAVLARKLTVEQRGRPPAPTWTPLLAGTAYYGERQLRADVRNGQRYYRTRSGKPSLWIAADALEEDVLTHLRDVAIPDHVVVGVRQALEERTSDAARKEAARSAATAEAALLDIERKSALGQLPEAMYQQLKAEFTAQRDKARQTLNEPDMIDKVAAALTTFGNVLSTGTASMRAQAMRNLLEKVIVDDDGTVKKLEPRGWVRAPLGTLRRVMFTSLGAKNDPYGTRTRV